MKADGEQSEATPAETDGASQESKASSKSRSKGAKDSSKQGEKAKHSEKKSDKSKKNDKGKGKGKKRDMDDLRSKLPPDLQGKIFDMKDMDLDSLKAKLDTMKLEKQGMLRQLLITALYGTVFNVAMQLYYEACHFAPAACICCSGS